MGPDVFLQTVVEPDIADLRQQYDSLRYAYHAIASVDALAAHIFVWCQRNNPSAVEDVGSDGKYRNQLAKRNNDFALVRDLAKANKHVLLENHTPQVTDADDVRVGSLGYGQGGFGEGRYGGVKQVVVYTNDGDVRVVETVVCQALDFLKKEISRVGIG